jgi:Zinc carboxypeptidase
MKKIVLLTIVFKSFALCLAAQTDLSYYLPKGTAYNPLIPTPKSVIGHEVGEWHVTHDRLVNYIHAVDKVSDRVSVEVTGYTYEARPLLLVTITSPKNQLNLENIRTKHVQLADPVLSGKLETKEMPAVFYIGFSIHGNEASGVNAGLLAIYHLAAADGPEIENYLNNTVILLDPCYNPDGMQRFSSWVNSRKSQVASADPNDTEHNEAWPGGRYNHYWFDLNRDWLVAQHPESKARVKNFHRWKPNVLTDHHEMGTNATFFFQPGVPSRVHPLTPTKNQELTKRMGEYHARALDEIGSFYYTQEGFDDYNYGKGSTFPDVQGAIGILFEQASSRGHVQESLNGHIRFPFTIRNQFVTALSSIKAVYSMREELLNYQRQFFKDAQAESSKDPVKAYIFGSLKDQARATHLAEILALQNIDMYATPTTQTINGKTYSPGSSYLIPLNQPQYRFVKAMFEKRLQFKDSLFYDISGWTLPLAFGLEYDEIKSTTKLGEKITGDIKMNPGKVVDGTSNYAYVFESYGYYTPRAIYRLQSHGLRLKVASDPFFHPNGRKFDRGTILVPVAGQDKKQEQIDLLIKEIVTKDFIDVYAFHTGLDYEGSSLGSNSFLPLKKPMIAMIVGEGISPTEVGEVWHMLDSRYHIPVTLIPLNVLEKASLNRYSTIIMPPSVGSLSMTDATREKIKGWTQNGGVLIGLKNAVNWLNVSGMGRFEIKKDEEKKDLVSPRAYADIEEFKGAQETTGAILEASVDLTHPLLYGYTEKTMPVFSSNNLFMEKSKGPYSNPVVFTDTPVLSGYLSKENFLKAKSSSVVGVTAMGQGRIIAFTENLCFRGFWLGTNKMFMNAILYGPLINSASSR